MSKLRLHVLFKKEKFNNIGSKILKSFKKLEPKVLNKSTNCPTLIKTLKLQIMRLNLATFFNCMKNSFFKHLI